MNKNDTQSMRALLHRILLAKKLNTSGEQGKRESAVFTLTAQAKYFLFRVSNTYGFDCLISEPIRLLVPNLGISYKTIVKVKKELSDVGIVTLDVVSDGLGRPVDSFNVHADYLEQLLEHSIDEFPEVIHEPIIKSLLCWGERDDEACQTLGVGVDNRSERAFLIDEKHDLDANSRVFLAALFAYADEFGFVSSLGHCDIEAITGFNAGQQKRLVNKLKKSGYIRSVIRGFTEPKVFGRVHTTYCLNTQFKDVDGFKPLALTVFSETLFRQAHEKSESAQLFQIANPNRFNKKDMDDVVGVVVRSLVGQNDGYTRFKQSDVKALKGVSNRTFYRYLQYCLDSYACMFLSMPSYQGRKTSASKAVNQSILDKIKCDVSVLSIGEQNTEEDRNLSLVLYLIAGEMADKYYELLSEYRREILKCRDRQEIHSYIKPIV